MLKQEEKSRTEPTLENMLRMSLHPKGGYDFMKDMNKELELSQIQSLINEGLGRGLDIMKYVIYAGLIYSSFYQIFK